MNDKQALEHAKVLLYRFAEGIEPDKPMSVNSFMALIMSDILANIGQRLVSENYRGKDMQPSDIYLVAAQELRKFRSHLLKMHKEHQIKEGRNAD